MRCLAFVVAQAVMRARGNDGALCSTGAASSDSTVEKIHHVGLGLRFCGRSLDRAVGNGGQIISCFQSDCGSIRLRFDCQRSKCSGDASARIRIFWKLVRKNVRRFIGRAVCVAGVMLRGTD